MPTLIDRHQVRDDRWIVLADADPLPAGDAPVLVSRTRWSDARAELLGAGRPVGVALQPDDDPGLIAADLPRLALVTVAFPSFTDGRGYSIARLLRERYHYAGELRAVGDILRDQLFYLTRCGFDSFLLKDGVSPEVALAAFADFTDAYQSAVDRGPLFRRRPAPASGSVR